MSRRCWVAVTLVAVTALTAGACAARPETGTALPSGCITDFDAHTDYFPDKSRVVDATNFTLSYHNSYQVLTVKQPYPRAKPQSYVLVRCGAPAPQLTGALAAAPRITVPVTSMYSASTTQLGMISELQRTDVITGVANTAYVVSPQLRHRVDSGKIVSYAPGQQIDAETVLAARPDVLVAAGIDDPGYVKLREAGVPVVADAEWLEPTPLGRAEWVKVLAALTGTEKKADELYAKLRDDYHRIARRAADARATEVLLGAMDQGSWSLPAGDSYPARLVRDAGGRYPWAGDTGTGSLHLSLESVYARAGHAPLWLVGSGWKTIADALAVDSRYRELAAVRDGQVWSQTDDYWERGAARPDLVLSDLVAILHPELSANHQFAFYRQVSRA
ncbi:ABC transporter substrate-binding protein [Mycobacterium shimoidei]|nr:ABC transporter substrate-binding protein [Mycobacterium shimoidei]MCV7257983.1 ABC transporter substrate-binding protein [Mycobacterium shimoidei]ODR14254.1 ABC transporter substrate-binding protein [Mycobacterium shimoidei]ORW78882.1 ABC transporter substrate-binding protein [Mycobacterium shimoidei]